MQRLTLFMIIAVTTFDYLSHGDYWGRGKVLPGVAGFVPELLGAIALVYVVTVGTQDRFKFVRPVYWLVLAALGFIAICGIAINQVESGPIVAGLRLYLRALPWFFVPAVFSFSDDQVRQQLRWLLGVCLLQIPFAIEQRITTYNMGMATGDTTAGTLGESGVLSIFLIAAICVLASFYERKRFKLGQFTLLACLLLLPTTINETKVTIILLPISLSVAFMCATKPSLRAKRFVVALGVSVFLGSIFVPIYDSLNAEREGAASLQEFFSDERTLDRYLSTNSDVGTTNSAGKLDEIIVPMKYVMRDPISVVFGYGIGNVSDSALGRAFTGYYSSKFGKFLGTTFSRTVLELGLLAFGLLILTYWLIFEDCRVLAREKKSIKCDIAAGWAGVLALVAMCSFYENIELSHSLAFLFCYFSGLIAAERMRLSVSVASQRSV